MLPAHLLQPELRGQPAINAALADAECIGHLSSQRFVSLRIARGFLQVHVDEPDGQAFRELGLNLDVSSRLGGIGLAEAEGGRRHARAASLWQTDHLFG
ncbi:hypothetical protein [Lentisalinibacter sediminis]|uniref:hypothetical protein n=1 Tax=Lentisalinibacter sediminis TaxID=2992237 RepID=UPI00386D928B